MNKFTSITIKEDLPEIADRVIVAAASFPVLRDALTDYEQACERMNDTQIQLENRALWGEIRAELAAEIKRLYLATARQQNNNQ